MLPRCHLRSHYSLRKIVCLLHLLDFLLNINLEVYAVKIKTKRFIKTSRAIDYCLRIRTKHIGLT